MPAHILTNKALESVVDTTAEWIESRTGIRERRIADDSQATSDLCFPAAEQALRNAGVEGADLDAIIVATITPDTLFPSTACLIQAKLGATKAMAFDLSAACTGFIYGLQLAQQGVESGHWRHVLIVGAETLSRIMDWTDRNTCVLFGDGAGAAVVSAGGSGHRILGVHLGADGTMGHVLTLPAGGSRLPASQQSIDERRHFIHMNGQEVYKFAVRIVDEACSKLLMKLGLGYEDVAYYIPHQANLRIIEGFAKRLQLSLDRVAVNLDRYGNMSGASIPVALHETDNSSLPAGSKVMLVGFGGGLTWGSCLLEWQVQN